MQHGIASDTNFKNYLTEVYAVYLYSSWEGLWKSYKAMVKNPVTLSGMGSTDHKKKKKITSCYNFYNVVSCCLASFVAICCSISSFRVVEHTYFLYLVGSYTLFICING